MVTAAEPSSPIVTFPEYEGTPHARPLPFAGTVSVSVTSVPPGRFTPNGTAVPSAGSVSVLDCGAPSTFQLAITSNVFGTDLSNASGPVSFLLTAKVPMVTLASLVTETLFAVASVPMVSVFGSITGADHVTRSVFSGSTSEKVTFAPMGRSASSKCWPFRRVNWRTSSPVVSSSSAMCASMTKDSLPVRPPSPSPTTALVIVALPRRALLTRVTPMLVFGAMVTTAWV